jgi:isopentenyl diphosphate isomerase/L-lactate dehydrogenase-like FMN-dependent dehydrogenase
MNARRLDQFPGIREFQKDAKRRLPKVVFDYIEGGADDEYTERENARAFESWQLLPRVLVDVSTRSSAVTLFGEEFAIPVLLAPTGMAGYASPLGELAAARAAEHMGTRLVVSTASAYSIEEVATATEAGHWFQLYPWGDRGLMEDLVARARSAGYSTLCVTVDVPVTGNRERDKVNGFTTQPRITANSAFNMARHPRWLIGFLRHRRFTMRNLEGARVWNAVETTNKFVNLFNPQMNWNDLAWLRQQWEGPLLVKGLSNPDDASMAVDVGCDGVIVSNHGGRQLDGGPATVDLLPAVVERIAARVPVLVDGGIRRGSDVVKALCLGASACLIGRPYLYGLAVGGQEGVQAVLECFRREIDTTLALLGCPVVRSLDATYVRRKVE